MRIAFVSQPWDTLQAPVSSGSIPIWTYETAKRLKANSQVVIYARRSEGQLAQEVAEGIEYRRVSVAGNKVCNAGCKAIANTTKQFTTKQFKYLSSRLYCLPYFVRVAADLKAQKCDIVHIHNFSQAVPIIRRLNPQIKIVLHMHCEWLTQFNAKMIAQRLAQCDLIIGCSDYITEKVKAHFPQVAPRCQRVYNGVDVQQFSPHSNHDSNHEQSQPNAEHRLTRNILFVGRISPEKGLHTLLSAFEQIADQFAHTTLQIVGPNKPTTAEFIADLSDDPKVQRLALLDPPNYRQNLQAQVPEWLAKRVSFVGAVSHLQLQDYFHQSALLVNPSVSEAFGMSLVEAMASGVPVVATQVGGMVDVVVQDETGLLVSADDPAALATAMEQLLADESLRREMGQRGRMRAEKVFAWEAIAHNLLTHYQHLLGVSA